MDQYKHVRTATKKNSQESSSMVHPSSWEPLQNGQRGSKIFTLNGFTDFPYFCVAYGLFPLLFCQWRHDPDRRLGFQFRSSDELNIILAPFNFVFTFILILPSWQDFMSVCNCDINEIVIGTLKQCRTAKIRTFHWNSRWEASALACVFIHQNPNRSRYCVGHKVSGNGEKFVERLMLVD